MRERTGRQTQPSAQMWLMLSSFPDLPRRHRKPANDDCAERPSGPSRETNANHFDRRVSVDRQGLTLADAIARQGPLHGKQKARAAECG